MSKLYEAKGRVSPQGKIELIKPLELTATEIEYIAFLNKMKEDIDAVFMVLFAK